ncbi:MAG: dihydroorotase [Thermanaerothrix sp.]|nr:dihydroorotase [Thermanaerothrix sp.]
MGLLLKNAKVFDGNDIQEGLYHLVIDGDMVAAVLKDMPVDFNGQVEDLDGKLLSPGFVDIHCHLREPGFEWREDLSSGSKAACAGGFTDVVAMPNTDPPVDDAFLVEHMAMKGALLDGARVFPAGCVSKGRKGEEMAELLKMAEAGAVLFTDDGAPVKSSSLLRLALIYLKRTGIRVMEHPEDTSLSSGGHVHEGKVSCLSGLKGIPSVSEELGVMRAIEIARNTGGSIHLTHISTARSVEIIRRAKEEGVDVTCDVTPHHLTFCEDDVIASGYDAVFKVNPPLRSIEDREALWRGLMDGTVDVIATDHAPWHLDEKDLPFQEASFGIASLECAAAAVLDGAVRRGIPMGTVLTAMSMAPRRIINHSLPGLEVGARADLTVLDLDKVGKVSCSSWVSKCKFGPWDGVVLKGWPVMTLVGGRIAWRSQD